MPKKHIFLQKGSSTLDDISLQNVIAHPAEFFFVFWCSITTSWAYKKHQLLYFEWSPPWHLYVLLLTNLLAFYLAYLLAFYLAYLLAYLLGISSGILSDMLSSILSGISSGIYEAKTRFKNPCHMSRVIISHTTPKTWLHMDETRCRQPCPAQGSQLRFTSTSRHQAPPRRGVNHNHPQGDTLAEVHLHLKAPGTTTPGG